MNNKIKFDWFCKNTWAKSAKNTLWCLTGCSIGDFGTIYYFQITPHSLSIFLVMSIAIINGILTSIILETIILVRQNFKLINAFKTACGMSLISMVSMELSMNLTDYFIVGSAKIVWWVIPIMLLAGFLTPWPYNYWRLKKFNISCH
mgnify:CR=1 FL=1